MGYWVSLTNTKKFGPPTQTKKMKVVFIKLIFFIIHVTLGIIVSIILPIIFLIINGIEDYINDKYLFPYFIILIIIFEFCRFIIQLVLLGLITFTRYYFNNKNKSYYFNEILIFFISIGFTTKSWLCFFIHLNIKTQSGCNKSDFMDFICILSSPWNNGYKWYLYLLHILIIFIIFIDMIFNIIYIIFLILEFIYMIISKNKHIELKPLIEQEEDGEEEYKITNSEYGNGDEDKDDETRIKKRNYVL